MLKSSKSDELVSANKELAFQIDEKERRAEELLVANKELAIANKELAFQNNEKEKRAAELIIANEELVLQNIEKEKRVTELRVANYARILIEASLDPLFTISPTGKITDLNNASVNITGLSREKLIGTDFLIILPNPKRPELAMRRFMLKVLYRTFRLRFVTTN